MTATVRTLRRLRRIPLAALVATVVLSVGTSAAAGRSALPHLYVVSLGDSYTAGNGAGNYYPASSKPDNGTCHRSYDAYPWRYVDLLRANDWAASIWHVACSGAVVSNLTSAYRADSGKGVPMPAQIAEVPPAFRAKANVVLLTIGGNDLHFTSIVGGCFIPFHNKHCGPILAQSASSEARVLANTENALRAVGAAMPHAQVVLLGYPRLTSPVCPTIGRLNSTLDKMQAGFDAGQAQVVTELDRGLGTTRFHYIPTASTFNDRGPCDLWGTQLVHNVVKRNTFESFHPNAQGYQMIANLLYATGVQSWVPSPTAAGPTAPTTSFAVGSAFRGRCTIAWPTGPTITSTQIQMTMECPNVPESQYLFTVVVYDDPHLAVTPSNDTMDVTGRVVDVAKSAYGFSELVVQASRIELVGK